MEEVKIKTIKGNYRYKMAENSDGTGYLVDLEAKVQHWLSPFGDHLIKRKCFILDKDQVKKIGAVGIKYNSAFPRSSVAIGLFLAVVYRIVGRYISINLSEHQRIIVIAISCILAVGLKIFMMIKNGRKIESEIGSLQKLTTAHVKFKGHNPKVFRAKLFMLLFCIIAVLFCTYSLLSWTFDVVILSLDVFFFYFLINFSLFSLTQNSEYQISK